MYIIGFTRNFRWVDIMQVKKSYLGTIENLGTTNSRLRMIDATNSVGQYGIITDFVNQTIANFLHDECGIDARYGIGEGSTEKFLWIFGAPFLFYAYGVSGTSMGYWECAGYCNSGGRYVPLITNMDKKLSFFKTPTSGDYSFSLVYLGNATEGYLRFQSYNSSYPSCGMLIAKTKNILRDKDSMIYSCYTTSGSSNGIIRNIGTVTFNKDGSIDKQHTNNYGLTGYYQQLLTPIPQESSKQLADGNFPLVPIIFGVHKPTNMYCIPTGFNLTAQSISAEAQTEITIGDRTFAVTAPDSNITAGSQSYLCCGLLEYV